MKDQLISEIERNMIAVLDNEQMRHLNRVLAQAFWNVRVESEICVPTPSSPHTNEELCHLFLAAKKIEGCSAKTLNYYQSTLEKMIHGTEKSVLRITTDDVRRYLYDYQIANKCENASVDNIRRILSSFFSWLENEDYILKSPVRRIRKIKSRSHVKETYTDEALEKLRDACDNSRDLAIIDLLASTGMRVGELVRLNIEDIDLENRECVVLGKGNKERPVYFDARTKIHLDEYLRSRRDNDPALFVSLLYPFQRLQISGIETRLRQLGRKLNMKKVHPHKFRRTMATRAIDKGMPVEQVQQLLGHTKIDTTMQYAMVSQNNVKASHRKYIS